MEGHDTISVCLNGDPAYPLFPSYPGGGKNQREKYFGNKLSSARITIQNAFGRPKVQFRCLHRAMDIDIDLFYITIAK